MKIYINKYKDNWLSPYTIVEKLLFWKKDHDYLYDEPGPSIIQLLDPICRGLHKVSSFFNRKINYVKIDNWDTWSMDGTLSTIILPMLKQLQLDKHGAPFTDDSDVPEELKSTSSPKKENNWDTDDNHFLRWQWIINELIWTFTQIHPDSDWESQFHTGVTDVKHVPCKFDADGKVMAYEMVKGPNDTRKFDKEGYTKYSGRIDNGLRLFGKYYRGLWS